MMWHRDGQRNRNRTYECVRNMRSCFLLKMLKFSVCDANQLQTPASTTHRRVHLLRRGLHLGALRQQSAQRAAAQRPRPPCQAQGADAHTTRISIVCGVWLDICDGNGRRCRPAGWQTAATDDDDGQLGPTSHIAAGRQPSGSRRQKSQCALSEGAFVVGGAQSRDSGRQSAASEQRYRGDDVLNNNATHPKHTRVTHFSQTVCHI